MYGEIIVEMHKKMPFFTRDLRRRMIPILVQIGFLGRFLSHFANNSGIKAAKKVSISKTGMEIIGDSDEMAGRTVSYILPIAASPLGPYPEKST